MHLNMHRITFVFPRQREKELQKRMKEKYNGALVRPMTEEDLLQVETIERECFSMPWSFDAFKSTISREDTLYLVISHEEQILGYCGMYISFDEGEIPNVAVRSDCRNLGLGEVMLRELLVKGQERGVVSVFLEVRKSNGSAQRLYEKLGFEVAGVRKNFYEIEPEERRERLKQYGFNSVLHANSVVNRSRMGETEILELMAVSVGDISFATAPIEMFNSHGRHIKDNTPFAITFMLAYSNGSHSYIPDLKAFEYDCYEKNSCHFLPGTGEEIAKTHVELLNQLNNTK